MENLQMYEWQVLSGLLERLYQLPPHDAFPAHLLRCVRQWVNVDWAAYMNFTAGKIVLLASTTPDLVQHHWAEQLFWVYLQQSEVMPKRIGSPHLLLPIHPDGEMQSIARSGLFLSRQTRSFTTYDDARLGQIRPHIWRAEQNWLTYCDLLKRVNSNADAVAIATSDLVSLLQTLGLTARQAEVMQLVAQGKDNPAVAKILGCSTQTVKKHLEGIYGRLEVTTRAAAISAALERTGLLITDH
jgi:DNA-binding CsgD family transcriptional regulator